MPDKKNTQGNVEVSIIQHIEKIRSHTMMPAQRCAGYTLQIKLVDVQASEKIKKTFFSMIHEILQKNKIKGMKKNDTYSSTFPFNNNADCFSTMRRLLAQIESANFEKNTDASPVLTLLKEACAENFLRAIEEKTQPKDSPQPLTNTSYRK